MFKEVLRAAPLEWFAEFGLLVFFAVFVGIAIWTLTRSRRQIDRWSSLPLASDDQRHRPVERRGTDSNALSSSSALTVPGGESHE